MATLDTAARLAADVSERAAVNVGVVGLGYWGPNLVRNFQDSRSPRSPGCATGGRGC